MNLGVREVKETLNPMLERFQQTAAWAEWAIGLKSANKESILWFAQGHRPFRQDCTACVLDMPNGPQHRRRLHGGTSAWSMGVDIVQFGITRDDVTHVDVKYAVVATALVPRFEACEPTVEPLSTMPTEIVKKTDWGEGLDKEEFGLEEKRVEEDQHVSKEADPDVLEAPRVDSGEGCDDEKGGEDHVQKEIEECQNP